MYGSGQPTDTPFQHTVVYSRERGKKKKKEDYANNTAKNTAKKNYAKKEKGRLRKK
jgi:hypothetical protein